MKYKYIGKDDGKNGYTAELVIVGLNRYYLIRNFVGMEITTLSDEFVENEEFTWLLIKTKNETTRI